MTNKDAESELASRDVIAPFFSELKQQRRRRLGKRHVKKWIRSTSNFIALIPTRTIRQMLVIFSGAEFKKTVWEFRKRKRKSLLSSFTSFTKREIRHFHVVVVQRRQRNVQTSVMHVQSCCFANLNLLLFCRSSNVAFKLPNIRSDGTLESSVFYLHEFIGPTPSRELQFQTQESRGPGA